MATGKVRKRGKNWQIDISLGYVDGKQQRNRWTSKAATKAEATEEMNRELYKLNRQTRTGEAYDNDYNLADLFEDWKEFAQKNVVNPKTRAGYIDHTTRAINTLASLGVTNLIELTPHTADKMLASITTDQGFSHTTANKDLARLKKVIEYGIERKRIAINPILKVKPLPPLPVKIRRALSIEEGNKLLEVSPPKWATIWNFILSTGLRKQEFIQLRWKNVDLEGKVIRVLPTDKWKPKTKSGSRTIPLSSDVVTDLKALPQTSEYVFVTHRNTPLSNNLLREFRGHMYKALCAMQDIPCGKRLTKKEEAAYGDQISKIKEDLKQIDLHALRYTFCTHLISSGVDIKTVQKLMGHKSPNVTLEIYAQYCHGNADLAIDKLPWIKPK